MAKTYRKKNVQPPRSKPPIKQKYISTPEMLWDLFEEYRDDVKSNPRTKVEYVGKDGDKVETPLERPLQVTGFYCWCYDKGYTVEDYFNNLKGAYDAYSTIVTRIRTFVKTEQVDGAAVRAYDPNLVARLNGIGDKQQLEVNANVNILSNDPLADK